MNYSIRDTGNDRRLSVIWGSEYDNPPRVEYEDSEEATKGYKAYAFLSKTDAVRVAQTLTMRLGRLFKVELYDPLFSSNVPKLTGQTKVHTLAGIQVYTVGSLNKLVFLCFSRPLVINSEFLSSLLGKFI